MLYWHYGSVAKNPSVPVVGIRMIAWARFTNDVYRGVVEYMRVHQPWLIQTPLDSTHELEPVQIDAKWEGNGLIVFRLTPEESNAFKNRGISVVSISSESLRFGIPVVVPDFEESGRIVARHFISHGIRNFAYWGDQSRFYSRARSRGFVEVLEKAGFSCHQLGVELAKLGKLDQRWKTMREIMLPQLRGVPKPIGIFTKDDIAAATIINACQHLGFSVPDDVAVAGPNNDELFCYTTTPPLTAVRYPGKNIGYEAAAILDRLMHGRKGSATQTTVIPVEGLEERESTDTLHIPDVIVADSIRRIRREAICYPLQVNELVAASPLSRAAFKRRFVLALGYSPKVEIKRVRLDYLRDLLRTTDWSVKQISTHMGFQSMEELGRFMRRETGMTATAFRAGQRSGHDTGSG